MTRWSGGAGLRDFSRVVFLGGASAMALMAMPEGAAAQATEAAADNTSNAIVVTAQRRQELSRDVPITVTSASAGQLEAANVQSLVSLPKLAPGVRIDQQGSYTQPTIRGIGTTLVQTGVGSSVGTYVDGFYLPNALALDFDFVNVTGIQVLKGPQGTLFGRNTTGGAILVSTADPGTETGGSVEASYARFNARKIKGYVTAGITPDIAFSIEGQYSAGDGFQHANLYDGSLATGGGYAPGVSIRHPGAYEKWSVRAGVKAWLSDSATLMLRYMHEDRDDPRGVLDGTYAKDGQIYSAGDALPGTVFALGRRDFVANARTSFRLRADTVQLTGEFDLGSADLKSYSQYREEQIAQFLEGDYSSASVLALSLPERDKIMSQELVLNSKPGGRLQYSGGIFLFRQKVAAKVDLAAPFAALYGLAPDANTFFDYSATGAKISTYAAFADLTYEVFDRFFVTGGLRLSRDEVKDPYYQTYPGVAGLFTYQSNRKDDKLTPRIVLRYKPTQETSIYASFTKGYKSAIPDYRSTSGSEYLEPEEVTAWEAGFKYGTGHFSAELAGFYYDYKNLQNGYYRVGETILSNAAKSRIKGLEASMRYDFGNGFEVSAAGTYLDAKYRNFPSAGYFAPVIYRDTDGDGVNDFEGFNTSSTVAADGNRVQHAPKFSGNVSARYASELAGGRLVTSASLFHTSKIYFDAANQFSQGTYDILSARVEWTDPSDHWTVAAFGDNLFDETYYTQIQVGTAAAGVIYGEPATYGISLRYRFGAN
ncbi:TonB-dependent receptor [Novosphingobium album (ex Hu et al. 2023)]|uniref:TonB-dependent receptor n=1 Tax=Novosphingobium album (ex Hu et al. 2023) TaxID=2930093 RepID=A0ABT0B7P6_9SPHN|nr:TonB-dependent receptor [Novosphingobium album (ex Hu et al. 2023)]MCJ2180854.1 TonB-dependent receptor [Novosphingobium album (ex Hu et al. 2023)]